MTAVETPPYEAKIPRDNPPRGGYKTAEQELSDALEGTAPALSRTVAGLVGPARTAELAKAIVRATDLAVRRHAMDKLADALAVVEEALDEMPPECVSPERACSWTCRVCGCTDETACFGGCYWVAQDLCSQCGDGPAPEADEAEQQARIDRFMAGGNDV